VRFSSLKSKLAIQPLEICWPWITSNGLYILLCIHMVLSLNLYEAYYLHIMDIKMHDRQWPTKRLVRVASLKTKPMIQPLAIYWHWIISNGKYIFLCIHIVFALNPSKACFLHIMEIKMHDHRWPSIWLVRVHSLKR